MTPAVRTLWLKGPDELAALAGADRLRPVLVRYRGATEGRFTAPAQDVADLVEMLTRTGRYVRDMSVIERTMTQELAQRMAAELSNIVRILERDAGRVPRVTPRQWERLRDLLEEIRGAELATQPEEERMP